MARSKIAKCFRLAVVGTSISYCNMRLLRFFTVVRRYKPPFLATMPAMRTSSYACR